MEDIPLLADHFIRHFNILQEKEISGLSSDALACLVSYNYPGNVRELENIIEHAFILCKSGLIEPHHLPENLCLPRGVETSGRSDVMSMKDLEAVFITNMLRRNQGNRLRTAKALGIHKSTLFRKIKALHIQIPPLPTSD
jgi:transcriptional regulator with PAS, ATPase and Fis domain